MTGPLRSPSVLVASVALTGGLAFIGSLGVGVVAYSVWFGVSAGPWTAAAALPAILVDATLFSGFALHHSLFARTGLKRWVVTVVSPALERTTYVWVASGLFVIVCWAWQSVPGVAWRVGGLWSMALTATQFTGVWMSLRGARQLDVWDLAGLRQALGEPRPTEATLVARGLYGLVRHPVYLGWVLMVWPAAVMTGTRLTFAVLSTAYLIAAIPFEERSLRQEFGSRYEAYARTVRWRIVPWVY